MKTNLLQNKEMSSDVYALRRQVIALIHEANKLTKLPRINVRVTDNHEKILGVAKIGGLVIWITEETVASRAVVFHEILHATCWCLNKNLKEEFIKPFSHMVFNAMVHLGMVR